MRRSFFILGATLLAAISCASLAQADSIRLSCISTISEANIKAIDIWVSYTDEASKKEVKSMTVLWTMPDGSAVDRTVKYSQDLSFDASSPGIFSWSGKEPGDTRPMHGYLQWLYSTYSNDPAVLGRLGGFVEAFKALGGVVAWGIDSNQVAYRTQAAPRA